MAKIGFVFFDTLHLIHHFVSVASELAKQPNYEVDIITYEGDHSYLFSLIEKINADKQLVKQYPTYIYRKIIERLKKRNLPSRKYLYQKHAKLLLSYDVLVFTDITHTYLFNKKTDKKPYFVLLMHGAGDGEYMIGEAYQDLISQFDLITLSGQKVKGFFDKMPNLPESKLKVCGYQKFDVVTIENKENPKLFPNDNPIVLYNPHFKENLSSWNHFGNEIFEFFYKNDHYNLIFAPHINLFKSKLRKRLDIDERFKNKENIHIDLGSHRSVNMSYTQMADLYLGDVSSQIYEFLIVPRPCIFINAHHIDWKNDKHYQNWKLGKVIHNIDNIKTLLETKDTWQKEFLTKQQKAIQHTFYQSNTQNATQKIVEEIKKLISN